MNNHESDKTVLITGASGGIGCATALRFAEEGWNCVIQYNTNAAAASGLSKEIEAHDVKCVVLQCDLTDHQAVCDMVEASRIYAGGFDAMVCCAGISDITLFSDIDPVHWHKVISADLDSVYNCCNAAVKAKISCGMERLESILCVSSVWGVHGASCESAYSAAKAGVIGLVKALAKELGPSGVRVNCVAPGYIDTPMNSCFDEDTVADVIDRTPLCRIGRPEEVASAIHFLSSRDASFITGTVLEVTGGFY